MSLALPAFASANAGGEAPACRDEAELARAAEALLRSRDWASSQAVSQSVRAAGSDAVLVRGFFFGADEAGADAFLRQFEQGADAPTVCGFAQSAKERLLLVAARGGTLLPLSSRSTRLRGRLSEGFSSPELAVADARGALRRWGVEPEALSRGIELPEGLVRPVRIQLLARGPQGVRPVAERVWPGPAGETANLPAAPTVASPPADAGSADAPSDVSELSARLQRFRSAHGRGALRPNALLDRVAAEHAEVVCARGHVGHEPQPGQDPQARLLQAGVRARRVGETVARAEDAAAAFGAFERSPAHRLSLLEPGFTDAGFGRAQDARHHSCVVILLAAWPRYVGR